MALLVALSVALGVAVGALERGLRRGAAGASNDFDLLIGAPGSQTQLAMATVFLQPEAIPLMPGRVLERLQADPDVAWASPIAFGDRWGDHPVVGVSPALPVLGGRRPLAEGRVFVREGEAVVGHAVPLNLGSTGVPEHGLAVGESGHGHAHADSAFKVIGRMPPTGTPWDWAVLVPVEAVWETHGLGNGHAEDEPVQGAEEGERIGPPWTDPPGTPAVVVAPRGVAQAYLLRGRYRDGEAMAFFPAEVMATLFRIGGELRTALTAMATAATALVVAATFLSFAALLTSRTREFAVLRALGAGRGFVLLAVWAEMAVVLGLGVFAGLPLGWLSARLLAGEVGRNARLSVPVQPDLSDALLAAAVLMAGLVAALLPAMAAWRQPPGQALK